MPFHGTYRIQPAIDWFFSKPEGRVIPFLVARTSVENSWHKYCIQGVNRDSGLARAYGLQMWEILGPELTSTPCEEMISESEVKIHQEILDLWRDRVVSSDVPEFNLPSGDLVRSMTFVKTWNAYGISVERNPNWSNPSKS